MEELMTMEQGLEKLWYFGRSGPARHRDWYSSKIDNDEVLVDIGGKSEGIIPIRELSFTKNVNPEDVVKVGDEIRVMVIKEENSDGNVLLSKKRVDQADALENLREIYNEGKIIEAPVVDVVKGGVIVDIGTRGFVPASRLTSNISKISNPSLDRLCSSKLSNLNQKPEKLCCPVVKFWKKQKSTERRTVEFH